MTLKNIFIKTFKETLKIFIHQKKQNDLHWHHSIGNSTDGELLAQTFFYYQFNCRKQVPTKTGLKWLFGYLSWNYCIMNSLLWTYLYWIYTNIRTNTVETNEIQRNPHLDSWANQNADWLKFTLTEVILIYWTEVKMNCYNFEEKIFSKIGLARPAFPDLVFKLM